MVALGDHKTLFSNTDGMGWYLFCRKVIHGDGCKLRGGLAGDREGLLRPDLAWQCWLSSCH